MWDFALRVLMEVRDRKVFWAVVAFLALLAAEPLFAWRGAWIAEQELKREQAVASLSELELVRSGADKRR